MSSARPPTFADLSSVCNRKNSEVNVMGAVTDFMPSGRTRGTDWTCSFSIIDSDYNGIHEEGLKVRFFRPMETELPSIRGTGDVVLLRCLRIKDYQGMTVGLSTKATTWLVFHAFSIPTKAPTTSLKLDYVKDTRAPVPIEAEMQYAISLCNSRDRSTFTEPIPASTSSLPAPTANGNASQNQSWKDKFSLIKDVACDVFYDLVGQAVKTYTHNDRVELYLTDYTSNNLLFNYEWGQDDENRPRREGDEYNYIAPSSTARAWPGPFGKMTLTVTLWPPHSDFARQNLKENDYVHLRNVRIKFSKDAKLEGSLHSDRRYPDRVDVTILKDNQNDDRVKDVLRRKRDYAKRFRYSSANLISEARGIKRKGLEDSKPLSRAQKKRRKQKAEAIAAADEHANKTDLKSAARKQWVNGSIELQKQDLNGNVNCANHLIPPRSLSSIISLDKYENVTPEGNPYVLPFQNIKSRTTVRVIDFFPSDLVDFAAPCPRSSEFDILSDDGDSQEESQSEICGSGVDSNEERRWEWRFSLRLEDATGPKTGEKSTLDVFVAGQDAECLLKLDAEDLRKSPTALATLREKLFLMWGDLEEQKSRTAIALKESDGNPRPMKREEAPKCKPFECCLKEYGIKAKVLRSIGSEDQSDAGSTDEDDWVWKRRWRMFGTTIV